MLVNTFCAAVNGLEVNTVKVEISMTRGVQFHLTGLADTAVKESHDRIRAALQNMGFKMPVMDARNNLRPDILLATMIVIGGIGFMLDFLIGKFEKKVLTHYGVH